MTEHNNWQQGAWGTTPPSAGGAQGAQPQGTPQQQPQGTQQAAPQAAWGAQAAGQANAQQQAAYPHYAYAAPQQAAPAQAAAAPKKRGWIVALVAVILFFALMFFGMASCTSAFTSLAGPVDDSSSVDLVTSDSIGIIDMAGTIQYDGTTCSPEGLKAQLDEAESNPHIKAVVLRVDSGGGTATAGEEMAIYVRDFSKPIVVSSASMNASAAYEISSQADYIYTAQTTAIGAIGTALQITDLSGLYEKLGINIENITSAESKDSSYGTRPLTDEERAHYQAQVDQINDTFIATVAEGRGMSEDEVRALATGMTFTGIDAVDNGLADEIGTLEDAVAKAAELAGVSSYGTVYLQDDYDDLGLLLDLMGMESGQDGATSVEDVAAALEELGINVGSQR